MKSDKKNDTEDTNEVVNPAHFIQNIIKDDLETGKFDGRVHTRFPPEPNGYLHIGHAKSICLNFGVANEFNGLCNLRMDDTNPSKEDTSFVDSIKKDVEWLGFAWDDRLFFASDYFERLYQFATQLIKLGKAYVDDLNPEEIREYRGTLTEPGKESPFRDRSVEENLDLFERMKKGEFEEGAKSLRAKIDMASGNLNMRDPVIYRILKVNHHRTGNTWNMYPMYDFAHCLSDSMENVTHSLCTLEFEDHRPLYDWILSELGVYRPQQIEFARLNMDYTVLSKRKLLQLVVENHVSGWDDPRMPTISGLRRRGYTPESIRDFCERIGVAKSAGTVEIPLLEHCVREDLNKRSARVMAVLRPLKVVIENYPEEKMEELEAENNPEDPSMGKRKIPFCREIFVERDDFMEDPPKKFFRLTPGKEVRLKHAYIIKCERAIKDPQTGEVVELRCSYDPETKSGEGVSRKVKGTLHWISARHCQKAQVRLYENLFSVSNPGDEKKNPEIKEVLNPNSVETLDDCRIELSMTANRKYDHYQFLRLGYFCFDPSVSTSDRPVFNRTVTLRDSWAKIVKKGP
jgi:glutaminyl-tRNA synthetase